MVRSIQTCIYVYLMKNKKEKNIENKYYSYLIFWLACCGFLFMVYYHPGYKPISNLYFQYANFQGTEKQEYEYHINKTNLLDEIIKI